MDNSKIFASKAFMLQYGYFMKEKYCIFECVGDEAKNILATAVISSIKKKMPERKIVVVTLFPEIWLHNPHVYRVYKMGNLSYFYDDYVKEQDSIILRHDPMQTSDFAYDKRHIISTWCDLCGVPYDGSLPRLYFTWREEEAAQKLTAGSKPLFFLQTHRGVVAPNINHFWATDIPMPIAEEVVEIMNARGYQTVHLKNGATPALRGATPLTFDLRQTLCAIKYSSARLFVDSFAQHGAAALGMPSVVTWVTGHPNTSGYAMHTNILPKFDDVEEKAGMTLKDFAASFKEGFEYTPDMLLSPYPMEKIYKVKEITDALEAIHATAKPKKQ